MTISHGTIDIPNRIYGIKWICEWADWDETYPGEVVWVSLDPPVDGDASFHIFFNPEYGDFQLSILGGRGPDVWDELIDAHIPTLSGAMKRAKGYLDEREKEYQKLEEIFESLALRGDWEDRNAVG